MPVSAGATYPFTMDRLIINCDLGEHESVEQTGHLLALIDAANICCGVHAGDEAKTASTLELAKRAGVVVGAHPGLAEAGGRGLELPGCDAFAALLATQVGRFQDLARSAGLEMHHVKLHGSLYHAVEENEALRVVYLDYVASLPGRVGLYALAGGRVAQAGRARELPVWEEVFGDRGYTAGGTLVARSQADALLTDPGPVVARLRDWQATGQWAAVDGQTFPLRGDTVCLHGDSPRALELARALRHWVDRM